MHKQVYINSAIKQYGQMTEAELRFARKRLRDLPKGAIIESKYFFRHEDWFKWPPKKRRARGADFARRWHRGDFPELDAYGESGGIFYVKVANSPN